MNDEAITRLWEKFTNDVAVTSDFVTQMAVAATKDASQFLVKNLTLIMDTATSFGKLNTRQIQKKSQYIMPQVTSRYIRVRLTGTITVK